MVSTLAREISIVFIVDDEALITKSLELILRRRGFKVSTFNNPLEAIEVMKTNPPDLLLSDVMMPQLSGVDLAILTAKLLPECRVLLFSASTADHLRRAREDGYDFRMLQKPVHPDELLDEIAQMEYR